jgi:general secretion pathway protein M
MSPADLQRELLGRWAAIAPRERRLLALALAALGVLLLWQLALSPIWRTWRTVPAQLQDTEGQWLRMQAQAAEARALKGATPISPEDAHQALQAATERLGSGAKLLWQGERATLTLKQIPLAAWKTWLQDARQAAHARPVEVQLQHRDKGWDGLVIVQLPSPS